MGEVPDMVVGFIAGVLVLPVGCALYIGGVYAWDWLGHHVFTVSRVSPEVIARKAPAAVGRRLWIRGRILHVFNGDQTRALLVRIPFKSEETTDGE